MQSTFMLLVLLVVGGTGHQQPDGKAIFESKGNCFACHGRNAKGTVLAPNLTDDTWLHVDGSAEQIVKLITTGVPKPKMAPAPMPPMGGANLTKDEIGALAKYIVSLRGSTQQPAVQQQAAAHQHGQQQLADSVALDGNGGNQLCHGCQRQNHVCNRGAGAGQADTSKANGKGCQHCRQQSAMPMMCPMHANRQKQ